MKKIKHFALGITGAALVTFGLYACSNDELQNSQQENTEQNSAIQGKSTTTSGEGYSYAANFYSEDISLGQSVDLIDSDTNDGITITEIIVNSDTRARGYIVNKLNTNEFLYFADVDRSSNVLVTYNSATTETITFSNLLETPDYLITNKFDFIEFSPEYATYGNKCGFFRRIMGACENGQFIQDIDDDGNCVAYPVKQEYFLWMKSGLPYVDTTDGRPCP